MGLMGPIRLIGPMRLIRPMGLMGLVGLMGLMGCSEDPGDSEEPQGSSAPIELIGCATEFLEANETNEAHRANEATGRATTRAWEAPSGYELVTSDNSISIFFTQDGQPTGAGQSPAEEFFFKSSGSWRVSKTDLKNESYFLYGYMTHDKSIGATISSSATANDNSTYSSGAVLTLENVPTATGNDLCVVVAAKNGTSTDNDGGLTLGQFEYEAQPTGEASSNNYVYLLFDHLYAALRINMKVDATYAALRTIKVKEIKLRTATDGGDTKKKTNVVITLNANNTGTSPIASIVYAQTGTDTKSNPIFTSENAEGVTLTTSLQEICQGYFMATGITSTGTVSGNITRLYVTSTYDVYDNNPSPGHPEGNLIRQDCEAENVINIKKFDKQDIFKRGSRYTVDMTIQPTYLYMLSEPDLDNPTVVVE